MALNVSLFSPGRTVLMLSDEALFIYTTSAKGVKMVETVPWDADNFEENVASVIARDCGRKPVLILNDMVEQHYRKERVLKTGVGVLDKSNVLKRKLQMAFPNYPVRAAFQLKEKAPKADGKIVSDVYIFTAVPDTQQFSKALGATNLSLASLSGFCLLPVESSDLVKTLSARLAKDKKEKPKWAVLIGQNRNGGLRQIVTKNGELALTRMTPVIDHDRDAEQWASEVYQEFKATMSYLSRFGYQPEDGLDVMVISNQAPGDLLEAMIEEPCNFRSLPVSEAARMVGVKLTGVEDERYADLLHVGWSGKKSRLILPMQAQKIDRVSRPRQMAMAASFALFCGAAFLGYQLLSEFQTLSSVNSDISDGQAQLVQLNVQYDKEVERKEALGFDVRLVQSSIAVYDALERNNIKPLALFRNIGYSLGKDLRVDSVNIAAGEASLIKNVISGQEPAAAPVFTASMQMTYPGTTDVEKGNQEVKDLSDRLQKNMIDSKVRVTKLLKDYEYVEEITVETGNLDKENVSQDFVAEIVIEGPPRQ